MAQQDKATYQALITSLITDGGANTAAELRTLLTNLSDSVKFFDGAISDLTESEIVDVFSDIIEFSDTSEGGSRKTPLYNIVPYMKAPVVAVATTNGTLASSFENGDTLDGVTLATGDRILLAGQTAPEENGIYVVAASGAPTRAVDFAGADQIRAGTVIYVEEGTTNAKRMFKCTSPTVAESATFVLGTDNIDFEQVKTTILGEDQNPTLSSDLDADSNSINNIATLEVQQEFYTDGEVDDGNSSTADTIDWTTGNFHKSTLTDNCTYTFTAPTGPTTLVLKVVQDGTGSRTVTWPAAVKWPSGTAPTLTTTAAAVDIISFYFDGTNYYGFADFNFS